MLTASSTSGLDRDDDFMGKAALQAKIDAAGPARRMKGRYGTATT